MPNRTTILKALVGTPVTIFFQSMDGQYQWFVNPQSIWKVADHTGVNEREIFRENDLTHLAQAKSEAESTGEPRTIEATAYDWGEDGQPGKWSLRLTINKTKDQQTGVDGFIYSCIDITEHVQREQTLKNLLREVAHRSKNMLAMVLSLSAQTSRVAPTKDEYIRRFTGRLQSLAKSQDVITDRDWRGSTLAELVRRQVRAVVPLADGQILFEGDNLELGPNGTVHVGLALHELVTNALVHGALTLGNGKVVIRCKRAREPDEGATLTWTEMPRVFSSSARPKSFGRTMLERIVPAAVNGTGVLELTEDAVIYTLKIGHTEIV
jgi:two-component sensor histidine kinase